MTAAPSALPPLYGTPTAPENPGCALKIALLGYRSHPHVGGQGIYLKYLSRALVDLGHEVDVLSGPPYPELDVRVRLVKIPSLDLYQHRNHLTALRWHHLRSFADTFEWWTMATGGFAEPYTFGRRIVQYLQTHGRHYDVIHDNQSLSYGLLELQKQGFPIVATVHHPITRDRQLALQGAASYGHRLLIRRWYSFLSMQLDVVKHLNHLITVSDFSKNDIADQFDCPADKIAVISNGIDTELFRPHPDIPVVPHRIITTTSSDQTLKGFAVLLRALHQLRATQHQAHLVVIGKLNPDGSNQKLLQQLRLEKHVTFKSGISDADLVEEYARSAVAVCPSLYEGFGLPAGEAMSCGVPLVSSDGGALPEVVGDGGLLVPAGDSRALADALQRVLTDVELARTLSARGRARIKSQFCWQQVAHSLTTYYRQTLLTP